MAMSTGRVVALIQAMGGGADPAVIERAVQDWLDAHPEATTTVQDGSITEQKLATSIAQKLGLISSLSDEIEHNSDVLNNAFDIYSAGWVVGSLKSGEGTTLSSTSRIRSPFIDVSDDSIMAIEYGGNTNCLIVYCYNSSKTYISDSLWTDGNYFEIPDGTGFVRILLRKNENNATITADDIAGLVALCKIKRQIPKGVYSYDSIQTALSATYDINSYNIWKRQTIGNGTGGENQIGTISKRFETSTTRISTNPIIQTALGQTITIAPQDGYKFYFYSFDTGLYIIETDTGWQTTAQTYTLGNGYMALVFAKTDNTTITLDDYDKLEIAISSNVGKITNLENRVTKLENALPSYWKSYMETKQNALNVADTALGFDGTSFAFITDVHVGDNPMVSPKLIKYVLDHTSIRDVICGGDIISAYQTRANAIAQLTAWRDAMRECHPITIYGNHDMNSNGQTDNTAILQQSEFYAIIDRETESRVNWERGYLFGTMDNTVQKIKYIFLGTGAPDNATIGTEQTAWFKRTLLAIPDGWYAVIFAHQFWTGVKNSDPTMDGNGTKILQAIAETQAEMTGKIACIIVGHMHRSYSMDTEYGFPVIATTCDANLASGYDPDAGTREEGTTTEQAFDLYYINTANKTIDVIRIGAGDTGTARAFTFT